MPSPVINGVVRLPNTATRGNTLTIGEPSAAMIGDHIFATGNLYAARSLDHGSTWTHIPPGRFLRPQPSTPFCCDQTMIHDASRNIVVWISQYLRNANENTLRIAVNPGATLGDRDWHLWDFVPTMVDASFTDEWFDYNHAALSDNFLYVGTNMYGTAQDEPWKRSIVLRFSLDELQAGGTLTFDYIESAVHGSLRCTSGAADTMYVVAQNADMQSLHIWEWPEGGGVTDADVTVSTWVDGINGYPSTCPDGTEWLGRCDDRITGAWVAEGQLGAMWTSDAMAGRPHPFIRAVVIETAGLTLVDEPDIFSADHAFAYPDACPSSDGVVGLTLFIGGGTIHPSHVVGRLESDLTWSLTTAESGTNGPSDGTWGDYIHCRRMAPNGTRWIATGFTLQGGDAAADIVQHIVEFSL